MATLAAISSVFRSFRIFLPRDTGWPVNPSSTCICGGIAEYFGVDATAVRLTWCVLSILCGAVIGGILAYLVAWMIIPRPATIVVSTATPVSAA